MTSALKREVGSPREGVSRGGCLNLDLHTGGSCKHHLWMVPSSLSRSFWEVAMGERARGRPHSGRFIVSPCRRYFPQSLPLSSSPSQSIDRRALSLSVEKKGSTKEKILSPLRLSMEQSRRRKRGSKATPHSEGITVLACIYRVKQNIRKSS